jgi:hypothetical protein
MSREQEDGRSTNIPVPTFCLSVMPVSLTAELTLERQFAHWNPALANLEGGRKAPDQTCRWMGLFVTDAELRGLAIAIAFRKLNPSICLFRWRMAIIGQLHERQTGRAARPGSQAAAVVQQTLCHLGGFVRGCGSGPRLPH